MSKTKWFVYTVILGLIPLLSRLLIAALSVRDIKYVSAGDLLSFGIALSITNISNIENVSATDSEWKTREFGISITFALLLGIVYAISLFAESAPRDFSSRNILIASVILTMACFFHSYSVLDRSVKSGGFS